MWKCTHFYLCVCVCVRFGGWVFFLVIQIITVQLVHSVPLRLVFIVLRAVAKLPCWNKLKEGSRLTSLTFIRYQKRKNMDCHCIEFFSPFVNDCQPKRFTSSYVTHSRLCSFVLVFLSSTSCHVTDHEFLVSVNGSLVFGVLVFQKQTVVSQVLTIIIIIIIIIIIWMWIIH